MSAFSDPFQQRRQADGVMVCPFQGERIPMILRHKGVREAAKNWSLFSSDTPFRVPIPSEEAVRTVRQLPIETDPPIHGDYRAIVEPFFKRPKSPEMIRAIENLVRQMVREAAAKPMIEVVSEFALPLQSLALTHLLDVPEEEAKTWISWGIHVFKSDDGGFKKENVLEAYLERRFDLALSTPPGKDFFSALAHATFQGRRLERSEMIGFANLAFAGGRDTVIHLVSCALGYFSENPSALSWLREDSSRTTHAAEEFFRVFMPLTHIGRTATRATHLENVPVEAGDRVSLCWASANFDESVFPSPHEVHLDRKPNPHVSFGFGEHLCLGAHHARLVVRTLLRELSACVERLELVDQKKRVEVEEGYSRQLGYDSLNLRFIPLNL